MKSIIELLNNRVSNVTLVSDYIEDKVVPVHPYRNYFGLGNAYARAIRQAEHRKGRGFQTGVMLVGEVDPEDYLFKAYSAKENDFFNYRESNEDRLHRVRYYHCTLPVHFFYDNEVLGIHITRRDMGDMFGRDMSDYLEFKFRKHEPFSKEDLIDIEKKIETCPSGKREIFTFGIGELYKMISKDEVDGAGSPHNLPLASDNKEYREIAIEWFNKLNGSRLQEEAMSEIASIYARSNLEDKAVSIYKKMLNNPDSKYRKEIRKKIHYLGAGRDIVNKVKHLYKIGDTGECLREIERFRDNASGRVLYRCKRIIDLIEHSCRGRKNIPVAEKYSIFDCIELWRDNEVSS